MLISVFLMIALIDNAILVGQASNSSKITSPKNSKDLTSQNRVLIKLTESGTTAEAKVNPKNIKVNVGTTVVWESKLPEKVYVQSKPDENHYVGELLNQSYIFPGESYQVILSKPATFIYDGSNGFGSYYVRGTITVVNETKAEQEIPIETTQNQSGKYDVSQIQWNEFTNDLGQFSVEYPKLWKTEIGNRFTGNPPLTAENSNGESLIPSWVQITVFDSDDKTSQKWAQTEKNNVDDEKDTKIIEPVTCDVYRIDGVQGCSFVYATEDKDGRTSANLDIFVNDNASQTHSIKYRTDSAVYDLEEPIIQHLLSTYKLLKNGNTGSDSNTVN
jgi:PsbP-like protein